MYNISCRVLDSNVGSVDNVAMPLPIFNALLGTTFFGPYMPLQCEMEVRLHLSTVNITEICEYRQSEYTPGEVRTKLKNTFN